MYEVLLAGGTASGKSTAARELERLGARRVDLDQVSRDVCAAGSEVCRRLAEAFGADVLDPRTGELDRALLARRAFSSEEGTRTLEEIELPAIGEELARRVRAAGAGVVVVEVPLLDRVEGMLGDADEVVCVICPLDVRRERARGRGMDQADFERRVAHQPTDDYLRAHADTALDNSGDEGALVARVDAWWDERERAGWPRKGWARGCWRRA